MIYQIEEIRVKKKRLVIVYVFILLLVLCISIGIGRFAVKNVYEKRIEQNKIKEEQINSLTKDEKNENKTETGINVQTVNRIEELNEKKKEINFYEIVEDIYNREEGKRVYLTFDDGPSKNVTSKVLDILKKYEIKATFFVLGNRVASNSELIKREYEEGHYIANHGYSHKYSKIYSSSMAVIEEYNKTEKAIQKALNNSKYSSNLFRFPGGSIGGEYHLIKQKTKSVLKKNNIAYLDWNALTNDANGSNTKEKIMNSLKKTVGNRNNVVVLMHDAADKQLTYETLEDVILYLKEKGYEFKNIYDLIETEEK